MTSKGLDKSAASSIIKSNIPCLKVYPQDGSSTVGLRVSKQQAVQLMRNLAILVCDPEIQSYITITGHKKSSHISVLGRKPKPKLKKRV
jgi:hypothetical protein